MEHSLYYCHNSIDFPFQAQMIPFVGAWLTSICALQHGNTESSKMNLSVQSLKLRDIIIYLQVCGFRFEENHEPHISTQHVTHFITPPPPPLGLHVHLPIWGLHVVVLLILAVVALTINHQLITSFDIQIKYLLTMKLGFYNPPPPQKKH